MANPLLKIYLVSCNFMVNYLLQINIICNEDAFN